jgi:hypothetical protein
MLPTALYFGELRYQLAVTDVARDDLALRLPSPRRLTR